MKSFRAWFNARKRVTALALIGLIGLTVLSSGRSSDTATWFRVPDLSTIIAIVLGLLALLGLMILIIGKPQAATRRPGEFRSIRAILVFTALVAIATQLFGPEGPVEEPPAVETQQPGAEGGGISTSGDEMTVSGTDIATLVLIAVLIAIVVARRRLRTPLEASAVTTSDPQTMGDLAPAVQEAHLYLITEADPRAAVLLAYATLEQALAGMDHPRNPAETPTEHIRRVLTDLPYLSGPALHLGRLYELARFSDEMISEDQRQIATHQLEAAQESLEASGVETA